MVQVILMVILIGLLVGVANYLLKDYVEPKFLDLANKLAFICVLVYVALYVLGLLGIAVPSIR
jgi:hypothetical protein